MSHQKLVVPTFVPDVGPDENRNRLISLRHEESGVRLVLDENGTGQEHDLLLERQPGRWLIFLHANGGDPVVVIDIRDDTIAVEDDTNRPLRSVEVDPVKPGLGCPVVCDKCQEVYDEAKGDGYCGLCPTCADETTE